VKKPQPNLASHVLGDDKTLTMYISGRTILLNKNATTARIVGILFIIGTISGILSLNLLGATLQTPGFLSEISVNSNQSIIGALCILLMGFSLAMIPVVMYPILKKQNEVLALGYLVFRGALETGAYIGIAVCWLILINLSQSFVSAATSEASLFQNLAFLVKDASDWVSHSMTMVFIIGAFMYYSALYQSRLVPRWLSGWGLLGAIVYITADFLAIFSVIESNASIHVALLMPLALQEMVLALWLIIKGFNASAPIFETAKTTVIAKVA
jgi:hypothetical protein